MRHWVFDLDGTLVDSFSSYHRVLTEVLLDYDVRVSTIELEEAKHVPMPQFLAKFVKPEHLPLATERVLKISLDRLHEIQPFEGILDVLDQLKSHDCHLSVWTARERLTADAVLKSTKLDRYFERLVSRTCVPRSKPHPDGLQRALSEAKTLAGDALMIGDHAMDMHGAKAAGVKAIGVCWNTGETSEVGSLADHHFLSVPEFHAWTQTHLPEKAFK